MSTIKLKSLDIRHAYNFEVNPDGYVGEAQFEGTSGKITIQLDNQLCSDVLKLCAASMTRATKELANNMTAEVFEQAGLQQIECKEETPKSTKDLADDIPF